MGRTVDLDDLLDAAGVAEMIGLRDARSVSTYRARDDRFPAPVLMSSGGRCQFWHRGDIEVWLADRKRGRA